MKKIIILFGLGISVLSFAQINVQSAPNITIPNESAFLDATQYVTAANNVGKGLIFPKVDLTTFTFVSPTTTPSKFRTAYDGMIVYNTATGQTGATASASGVQTSVQPGFYYFYNPTGATTRNVTAGVWKPLTPAAVATGANNGNFWAINGNSGVPVDQAKIGTTDNVPVQIISNGATFQTYGVSNSDASFRKVVINPNGSANTTMAKSKTVGGAGFDFALEVAGKSWFENGIVTSNSTYPDYVFDKYFTGKSKENAKYSFLTLAETEKYIKENNHLPGVTAIGDLAKGGSGYMIDVTQLSVQSLEKIEELYLHMIEQQKQIELLQKEIEVLKASSHK